MLAIPVDNGTENDVHRRDGEDPLIKLVHKLACKLGLFDSEMMPPEYVPVHNYRMGIDDIRKILFREAGITADSSTGVWDVKLAFSREKFDEKTKAFWEILKGLGEWDTLGQHFIPLMDVMLRSKMSQKDRWRRGALRLLTLPRVRKRSQKD